MLTEVELHRAQIRVLVYFKRDLLRRAVAVGISHEHGEGICSWSCGNTGKRAVCGKRQTSGDVLRVEADVVRILKRRSREVEVVVADAITGGDAHKTAGCVPDAVGAQDRPVRIQRCGCINRRAAAIVPCTVPEERYGFGAVGANADTARTRYEVFPQDSDHDPALEEINRRRVVCHRTVE